MTAEWLSLKRCNVNKTTINTGKISTADPIITKGQDREVPTNQLLKVKIAQGQPTSSSNGTQNAQPMTLKIRKSRQ